MVACAMRIFLSAIQARNGARFEIDLSQFVTIKSAIYRSVKTNMLLLLNPASRMSFQLYNVTFVRLNDA